MRIERELDQLFPALDQNKVAKKDVLDILIWRDLRLKNFMDFAIILEEIGVEEFTEFDFQVRKLAQVESPIELMTPAIVRALVNRSWDLSNQLTLKWEKL